MSILRMMRLGVLVALSLCPRAALAKPEAHTPVAIVYSLTGEASLTTPSGASRPVRLFDHLPVGTTVIVGPSSRLAMALRSGLRFELGEHSQVKLGWQDLAFRTGPVLALPRIPLLPCLLPIAAKDRPGPRAGAVRIRGGEITGLYPRGGATTLAEETVLRFGPVTGASSYQVEIVDDQGRNVFRAEIQSPPVKIPPGKLVAGHRYLWSVRTVDRPGAVAHGEAELVTLSESAAIAREETRKILEAEKPGSLLLLAEIDRSLGLWLEADEDLRAALAEKPGDPALREALGQIVARLEHEDDPE